MSDVPLVPVMRPDGRRYRPRRIVVQPWEDDNAWGGWSGGVYVLGTHDVEATRALADAAVRRLFDGDMAATRPYRAWVRLGYTADGQTWITDETRGRAAVCWLAAYPD